VTDHEIVIQQRVELESYGRFENETIDPVSRCSRFGGSDSPGGRSGAGARLTPMTRVVTATNALVAFGA